MSQSKKKKKHTQSKNTNIIYTADEVFSMMNDTSNLVVQENTVRLSAMGPAASESGMLTDSIEFWNWMDRNYSKSGHFSSAENMQQYYANGTPGQQNWAKKVVQGKGYEWDWMSSQRKSLKNLFKTFDAGDIANRPGSDITEINVLTGAEKEYQLKAYTSSNKPHLKNTPKDMAVVTNAEKVEVVAGMGYEEVVPFGDNNAIAEARDARLNQMATGKASPSYTVSNVSVAAAKAGMVGFVISAGTESVVSYRKWKNGNLSTNDYLKEIMKSGGNAGITATCSAGIMVPVTATITSAGMSSVITIPISFVVSVAVDKVIAPAFARGDYAKILKEATYYQNMAEFCSSLAVTMQTAGTQYISFVHSIVKEQQAFDTLSGTILNQQAYDDFEYYASLPQEEISVVISGMLALVNDTDEKLDSIENQNFAQRMFKTVIGKNKATKEEIKRNYEKLTVYISKAVEVLFERQCIDQKVIQILGSQIISLRKDNIALNYRVSVLESRMDNITDSLLLATDEGGNESRGLVKEIIDENAKRTYDEAKKLFSRGKLIDAFDVFKKASDCGIGRANYYLGEFYYNGYGHIKEDRGLALDAWKKGMELGDPISTYKYGIVRYDSDEYQCRKWTKTHINALLRLVKENEPEALYEYGWSIIFDNPSNIDNLVDSLKYFKKAAERNYWPGAKMFFQLTEDLVRTGSLLPDYSDLVENVEWYQAQVLLGMAEIARELVNPEKAAKHFHKSLWLREDIVEPAAYLAFIMGTGLVEDSLADGYSKSNIPMYYSASMKSENPLSLYQLGTLYYNGVGDGSFGKDVKKAFECFKRSYSLSKQGFTAGILGYMSLIGEGTQENEAVGLKYLEEGYKLGDRGAISLLALCYEQGFGVKKNLEKRDRLNQLAESLPEQDEFLPIRAFVQEILDKSKTTTG